MTVMNSPPPLSLSDSPSRPLEAYTLHPHRWTADEYFKLSEAGVVFTHRTELIDGEIFDVTAENNPHVAAISKIARLLIAGFDERYWVTIQSTVRLPSGDIPEPDFAVRSGPASPDNAVHPLPLLVIEVSDETLLFDQIVKSSLYAANGIPDYWIVNVKERRLEVFRKPVRDDNRKFGWRYEDQTVIVATGAVQPLAKPDLQWEVIRLLP